MTLGARLVLSAFVTAAVVATVVFALLVMLSGVNRPPRRDEWALLIPAFAPAATILLARIWSHSARECSIAAVSVGACVGLGATYLLLEQMAHGSQVQVETVEEDWVQLGATAVAVFAGSVAGTYWRRPAAKPSAN